MKFKKNYMKLISGGIIGNSNCIGKHLKGWILNLNPKEINPILYIEKVYIDKNDRTAHLVGYSKIKELDINLFKQIPQTIKIALTPKQKVQKLITDIGGGWCIEKVLGDYHHWVEPN